MLHRKTPGSDAGGFLYVGVVDLTAVRSTNASDGAG